MAQEDRAAGYATLDEAVTRGWMKITEVTEAGHVPELKVENSGDTAVLIVDGEELDSVYRAAIALADTKKEVTDADLLALVNERKSDVPRSVELLGWSVSSASGGHSVGSVSLVVAGEAKAANETGNGPVNALYKAVDEAVRPVLHWAPVLTEYEIKAVSAGEDAQGQVLVRCRRSSDEGPGALVVTGHGLSTNIIEASLEAYLVATNKLHGAEINGVSVAFVGRRTADDLP